MALAGRILVTLLLAALLVGFGACGVFGMAAGVGSPDGAWILVLGVVGIAIAVSLAFRIASIWRKPRPPQA